MKPLQIAEDIFPIGEFKTHASRILRGLREAHRPVVITQHGKPAAVLVSPEAFDRMSEHARLIDAVREGVDDSKAGRVIDDSTLTGELDAEFGPLKHS